MVGTRDVRKVEREDKKQGRGKEKERWIKRSRKYRRGGYTVRIKSRSHGAVLFHVRCLVCPLRTQHEALCVERPVRGNLRLFFDISWLTRISDYQLPTVELEK